MQARNGVVIACLSLTLGLAGAAALSHEHGRKPSPEHRFDGDRRDMAPVHQEKMRDRQERLEGQKKDCEQEDRAKARQAAPTC